MPSAGPAPWRTWIVSELYYPEDTSTGAILTELAEGLADELSVHVLCGQPTYLHRGRKGARTEERHGVRIRRCWSTTLNKDVIAFRVLNMISLSVSMFIQMLFRFRRGDRVLVVTNPPLLPFLTAVACRLRGGRFAVLVHDVYPDALVATGNITQGALVGRIADRAYRLLYRRADRMVVLGRDMRALLAGKYPELQGKIRIITNWANLEFVEPVPRAENILLERWGLKGRFVAQYAGNMGRSHALEDLVEAARRMQGDTAHFLFVGEGAKQRWLKTAVREEGLENVTVQPRIPKSNRTELNHLLSACDIAMIAFVSGMSGISVPSRMYNVLAAGVPILAVADPESELARVVEEEDVGWVVRPGDADGVVHAIQEARANPATLAEMGARARKAAEERYTFAVPRQQFLELFTHDLH